MTEAAGLSRRDFVKAAAVAGAGLTLAVYLDGCADGALPPPAGAFAPDAFLRIAPDGAVTVVVGRSEMGQGASTGLAMIVAEELDADWPRVGFVQGPAARAYYIALPSSPLPVQITGASTSIRHSWTAMRMPLASTKRRRAGAWAPGYSTAACSAAFPLIGRAV